jgi:hypothetical protein
VRETHRLGAFSRATWLRLLADAGFQTVSTEGFSEDSGSGPAPGGGNYRGTMRGYLFVGRRRR